MTVADMVDTNRALNSASEGWRWRLKAEEQDDRSQAEAKNLSKCAEGYLGALARTGDHPARSKLILSMDGAENVVR